MAFSDVVKSIQIASKLAVAVGKSKFYKQNKEDCAQNYILNALASLGPGLPAKAAQIFNSKNLNIPCSFSNLLMDEEELITTILEYSPYLLEDCLTFSKEGSAGSLGEVHKALLKNEKEVAIKVQYPHIESHIQVQLNKLVTAANFATKLSVNELDTSGYLSYFSDKLKEETDYIHEGQNQNFVRKKLLDECSVFIPQVFLSQSNSKILVQEWVDFLPLHHLNQFSLKERQGFACDLFETFLFLVFKLNKIHGDFHLGNVGVTCKIPQKIVLLDFGLMMDLEPDHVQVLREVIDAIKNKKQFNALQAFERLGFQKNALLPLQKDLSALWEIFLRPFCTHSVFEPGQWNFQEESKKILGKHKILFRMAGPPWFLMLMRTFTGLTSCLKLISPTFETSFLVEKYLMDFRMDPPVAPKGDMGNDKGTSLVDDKGTKILSQFLCIRVVEGQKEKVFLQMPAAACENLENLIPFDVQRKLTERKINLNEMKNNILISNFIPQKIFEIQFDDRFVSVWLE